MVLYVYIRIIENLAWERKIKQTGLIEEEQNALKILWDKREKKDIDGITFDSI